MLTLYEDILGLQFHHVPDAELWHPDAKLYEVRDGDTIVGRFVFDLYPRKGKYGHAAAFPVVLGRIGEDGVRVAGLMALVCNFPKTTASNPSLLTHDEVETLLHEFGHIMHALLSGGMWQRQNGFGAVFDFVEMPSQLFEEWAWNNDVLTRLSSHYKSGEPMPAELQQKLIGARHHMDANFYLQQAIRALFDFRIHNGWPAEKLNADALAQEYRDMKFEYEAMMIPDSSLFPAGWSHMADYDAGYYSYLWSKVFALDLFTQFAANPLDRSVGARYRAVILEPGSSRPEMDIIREFLGREPSEAPFLAALGISE
jgi:thimet oligopeptidase